MAWRRQCISTLVSWRRLGGCRHFCGPSRYRRLPAMANIGIVDDGSDETGEVMNLMARRNLLFRVVRGARSQLRSERADRHDRILQR